MAVIHVIRHCHLQEIAKKEEKVLPYTVLRFIALLDKAWGIAFRNKMNKAMKSLAFVDESAPSSLLYLPVKLFRNDYCTR